MYELRVDGRIIGSYAEQSVVLALARLLTKTDPDAEIEVVDTHTGRAFEVAASTRWRDEIAATMR
jgi:hypothetical protein